MSLASGYAYNKIPIDQIVISEANVRDATDARIGLNDLKDSIRELGLLQPIVVIQLGENSYELVIGQRRYLAVSELNREGVKGFDTIEAKVYGKETDITQARISSVVENLQRRPLTEIDRERATTLLLKQLGKITEVSAQLGLNVKTVSAWLDYESIVPKSIRKYVDVSISRDYAKQIVAATYPDTGKAEAMIKELIKRGWAKNALIRQKLLMVVRKDAGVTADKAVVRAAKKAREVGVRFILSGYYADGIKKVSTERLGSSTKQAINETSQTIVQDWIDTRFGRK
jgi:ParB family chromosome partitioning protein